MVSTTEVDHLRKAKLTHSSALQVELPRAKRQASIAILSDKEDENPFVRPRSTRASARTRNNSAECDVENSPSQEKNIRSIERNAVSPRSTLTTRSKTEPARSVSATIKKHFNLTKSAENAESIKLEIKLDESKLNGFMPKPSKVEPTKLARVTTPSTPRHRDALSKQIPVTPRHRVIVAGAGTPRTPRTPSTPSQSTVYNLARQAFTRSNDQGVMVGREEEKLELNSFLATGIEDRVGGCTYVSGPPGTGKSATVREITAAIEESKLAKKAYVNCMSVKSSKDMSTLLLTTLLGDIDILESESMQTLQGMFAPRNPNAKSPMYIITLDEIDHILSLDLEFLYALFTWSMSPTSRLLLIGIANALDLTDRLLPRLKARNLKPNLLPFLPYTAAQIKAVLITRLKSLVPASSATPEFIPFLHPAALELCSRKVAAQSGDLRKAFDIVRRALDLIETETKLKLLTTISEPTSPSKTALTENPNLSTPKAPTMASLTVESAPRASIVHLNKVTSAAFSNGTSSRLKTLNLQQKAALCALLALERQLRASLSQSIMSTPCKSLSAPSIKMLFDTYTSLCKREAGLHPLSSSEFRDVVGNLETMGLVSGVDGRTGSFVAMTPGSGRGRGRQTFGSGVGSGDEKRVGSCVGMKEVEAAVEGVGSGILRGMLNGTVEL